MKNRKEMVRSIRHDGTDLLVRIACADAYAAAAEFLEDEVPAEATLLETLEWMDPEIGYQVHPRANHTRVSQYTDDTEMSVANARVLLGEFPLTALGFANAYIDEHRFGGYRNGYAGKFQGFLRQMTSGEEFLAAIHSGSSCKNGAVMRAGVIGFLPMIEQVIEVSTMQASVTHATPCGVLSARVAALATWYALHTDVPLADLSATLEEHKRELLTMPQGVTCAHAQSLADLWSHPWNGAPVVGHEDQSIAITTTRAALTLAATQTSFIDAVRGAIAYRGDTDSVAAVVAAITAPRHCEELPDFFEHDLEFGSRKTGVIRLRALGERLMHQFRG